MGLSVTRPGVRVMRRERTAPARARMFGYVLIAPLLIWLLATIAAPLAYSIYLSFTDAGTIGTPFKFIGLDNYSSVLGESGFWSALTQLSGSPLREQRADHSETMNRCAGWLDEEFGSNMWSWRTKSRAYAQ